MKSKIIICLSFILLGQTFAFEKEKPAWQETNMSDVTKRLEKQVDNYHVKIQEALNQFDPKRKREKYNFLLFQGENTNTVARRSYLIVDEVEVQAKKGTMSGIKFTLVRTDQNSYRIEKRVIAYNITDDAMLLHFTFGPRTGTLQYDKISGEKRKHRWLRLYLEYLDKLYVTIKTQNQRRVMANRIEFSEAVSVSGYKPFE